MQVETKIKEIIFTGKRKDGMPLIRNLIPFFMLHLNTDIGWISKFYSTIEQDPSSLLDTRTSYCISYIKSWEYMNMTRIRVCDTWEVYQEVLKQYRQDNVMSVNDILTDDDRVCIEDLMFHKLWIDI